MHSKQNFVMHLGSGTRQNKTMLPHYGSSISRSIGPNTLQIRIYVPKPCPFPFKTCTTCLSSLPYTSCPSPPSHAMSCRAPLSSPPHLAPLSDGRTLVAARCACSRQLLSLATAQYPLSPSHRRRSARRRVVCRRADLQGGTASPSLHQVEGLLLLLLCTRRDLLELSVGWPWPGGHSLSL